jgi:hypothetical protein
MLNRRHFLTTSAFLSLGALTLVSPAQAQNRITKPGLGFSFVMPMDYGEDDRVNQARARQGSPPALLYLTDGGINREDNANRVSKTLLTGIYVVDIYAENKRGSASVKVQSTDKSKENDSRTSDERELRDLYEYSRKKMTREEQEKIREQIGKIAKTFLPPQFAYQNGAMVTIDGYPAIAILTSADSAFVQEEITARFVLVPTRSRAYLFYGAYKNAEFENRSKAFMNFMQTIKFNERPEGEKKKVPAPTAKPKKK